MQDIFSSNAVTNSTRLFENGNNFLWIQLVMAFLSIVGSGSIVVFTAFHNLLGTSEVRALFFLSVTDLLLCFTWLVGAVLFKETCDNRATCYNLHAVEQIFYMSSFFYTLNYTWALYKGFKEYHRSITGHAILFVQRTCSISKIATLLSCVLPMLLMVPVFAVGNMNLCYRNLTQSYECLLLHTWALYSPSGRSLENLPCHSIHVYSICVFLITFILTSVGLSVLMAKARSLYRHCIASTNVLEEREWATLRLLQGQMLIYPSAFLVCWGPAFLLAFMILFNLQEVDTMYVVLYILQAFTCASQGLVNCVVYGWAQHRIRSMKAMEQRDADTQTPLLRSQKTRNYVTFTETD
ncbi:hypothetical protein MATL_G00084910 [Megalops atlanticus]|uniref:G-protein coupled receptors family 1 profile domain-containing protein n=1 Tax=Megalops atlanticus TaxID=7932 RepID=A0A9D3Q7U9_MEGAT|nr:hypothetical protein MATL_G00084910 [Megalops atlanticus]